MNKNIEIEYDSSREPSRYKIRRKKGKFTLDELEEICKEIGTFDGFAVMMLDVRENDYNVNEGDYVEIYDPRDVWKGWQE